MNPHNPHAEAQRQLFGMLHRLRGFFPTARQRQLLSDLTSAPNPGLALLGYACPRLERGAAPWAAVRHAPSSNSPSTPPSPTPTTPNNDVLVAPSRSQSRPPSRDPLGPDRRTRLIGHIHSSRSRLSPCAQPQTTPVGVIT